MKRPHRKVKEMSILKNPVFSLTTKAEFEAELGKARKEPAIDIFRTEAFTIESRADYSFTADG